MSIIMNPIRNSSGFLSAILDSTGTIVVVESSDTLPSITGLNSNKQYYLHLKDENQYEYLKVVSATLVDGKKKIVVLRGEYNSAIGDWEVGAKMILNEVLSMSDTSFTLSDNSEYRDISYNNLSSGLTSTNLQDAVDELDGRIDVLEHDLHADNRPYFAHRVSLSLFDSNFSSENLQSAIEELYETKAPDSHNHTIYYPKNNVDSLLSDKSDSDHLHTEYYTQHELQTSGQAEVSWDNITDPPLEFTTEPQADGIGFDSDAGLSAATVQAAIIRVWELRSPITHLHDTIYNTKTELSTDSTAQLHWENIIERPGVEYATGVEFDYTVSDTDDETVHNELKSLRDRIEELEEANTAMSSLQFDTFTIQHDSTTNTIKLADRIERNIMLNAFRITAFTDQSDTKLSEGMIDEFYNDNNLNINDSFEDWEQSFYFNEDDKTISPNGWNVDTHNYLFRRKIIINSVYVDSDLEDFTVLVKLTPDNFNFSQATNGYAHSEGTDIQFWVENETTHVNTLLEHEIVRFNPNTSTNEWEGEIGEFWVKIPELSSSVNTEIWMYYGNVNDDTLSDGNSAWHLDTRFISHMSPPTGYANSLTNSGNPATTIFENSGAKFSDSSRKEGVIWRSLEFPGLDDYGFETNNDIFSSTNSESGTAFTMQILVNPYTTSSSEEGIMEMRDASSSEYVFIGRDSNFFVKTSSGAEVIAHGGIDLEEWSMITAIYNEGQIELYVDGVGRGSAAWPDGTSHECFSAVLASEHESSGTFFTGKLEETKIYKGAMSSAWIKAEYRNVLTQDLVSVQDEEDISSEVDMIISSNTFNTTLNPNNARLTVFESPLSTYTLNTDLKAYVSKDDGSTWSLVTLEEETGYESSSRLLSGVVFIGTQSATIGQMRWKLTTENGAMMLINGVSLCWG